jgi:hypothetical protein
VHFVEDDELVEVGRQEGLGLVEPRPVGRGFEIEVETRPGLSHLQRERRLSRLARPEQRHRR